MQCCDLDHTELPAFPLVSPLWPIGHDSFVAEWQE